MLKGRNIISHLEAYYQDTFKNEPLVEESE